MFSPKAFFEGLQLQLIFEVGITKFVLFTNRILVAQCLWLTWDALSPDCFPLPAVCCLPESCIWRLKYRETLLIQLSDQSLRHQSLSLLPTISPVHSITEDTLQGASTFRMASKGTNHGLLFL